MLLVGGKVTLDNGTSVAARGGVNFARVTAGTMGLDRDGNNLSLNYPATVQRADVILTNKSLVSVFRSGSRKIPINARNLDILAGSGLLGRRNSGGNLNPSAGDIILNASENIAISGSNFPSFIFNNVNTKGIGNGGDIRIQARSLSLNNSFLSTTISGQGKCW